MWEGALVHIFSVGGSCETLAVNFTAGGPTHGHAGEAGADVQSFAALAVTGGDAELSSKFSRPKLAPGSFEFYGFGVTYTYWRRATFSPSLSLYACR